jgi:hypothetical protein
VEGEPVAQDEDELDRCPLAIDSRGVAHAVAMTRVSPDAERKVLGWTTWCSGWVDAGEDADYDHDCDECDLARRAWRGVLGAEEDRIEALHRAREAAAQAMWRRRWRSPL